MWGCTTGAGIKNRDWEREKRNIMWYIIGPLKETQFYFPLQFELMLFMLVTELYENPERRAPADFGEAAPPLGCTAPGLWGSPFQSARAPEWPLPCGSSSSNGPPPGPELAREVWTGHVVSFSLRKDNDICILDNNLKKKNLRWSSLIYLTKKRHSSWHFLFLWIIQNHQVVDCLTIYSSIRNLSSNSRSQRRQIVSSSAST